MISYDYGHNTPDDAPSGKKQTESEILSWLLIFFCFVVFWPLGLFLLIRKLSGDKKKAAQQSAAARGAAGMVCACAAGDGGNRAGGSADAQYTLGKERDPLGIETGRRGAGLCGASLDISGFIRYDWRTDLLASPAWTAGCVVPFWGGCADAWQGDCHG